MSISYGPSAKTGALGTFLVLAGGHLFCVAALLDIHLPAGRIRVPTVLIMAMRIASALGKSLSLVRSGSLNFLT